MCRGTRSYFFGVISFLLLALTLLSAQSVSAAQIKLAWDPNSESDLSGYKLYYGTSSRSYGALAYTGNVSKYKLTGLVPGQTYFVAVTAYDNSGNESGYSNEVVGVAEVGETQGDYDGDGKTDIGFFRASTGYWYISLSGGGSIYGMAWGGDPSDIPANTSTWTFIY